MGQIKDYKETEEGNSHFVLNDGTGSIEAAIWNEEEQSEKPWKKFIDIHIFRLILFF